MRSVLLTPLLLSAACAEPDTEAPTISLDLSAIGYGDVHRNNLYTTVAHDHHNTEDQLHNSVTCAAVLICDADCIENCPEPTARAWDHHDGDLGSSIETDIYLVNKEGVEQSMDSPTFTSRDQEGQPHVIHTWRAQWLLKYNVEDRAGNKADAITFSMVFDDPEPPVTSATGLVGDLPHVESCDLDQPGQGTGDRKYFLVHLPFAIAANDNIDGDLEAQVEVAVTPPGGSYPHTPFKIGSESEHLGFPDWPNYRLDTYNTGKWTFDFTVSDHAGMFGTDGLDNVAAPLSREIEVKDSIAPIIYCNAASCKYHTAFYAHGGTVADLGTPIELHDNMNEASCCTMCQTQARNRLIGSNTDPDENESDLPSLRACTHFTSTHNTVADTRSCRLYSGLFTPPSGVVDQTTLSPEWSAWLRVDLGSPVACQVDNTWECGPEAYEDPMAVCVDMRDSYEDATSVDPEKMKDALKSDCEFDNCAVDGHSVSQYKVQYNCDDTAGNQAKAQTRTVNVVDTSPPTLKITSAGIHRLVRYANTTATDHNGHHMRHNSDYGDATNDFTAAEQALQDDIVVQHSAGYMKDCAHFDELKTKDVGFACDDTCKGNGAPVVTTSWVNDHAFDCNTTGTFVLKYSCADAAGNSHTKHRTVLNVDATKPIITLNGEYVTIEASATETYLDSGATCSDQIDGMISMNVVVSGQAVDRKMPGTYTLKYDCADTAGNNAITATRTIIVDQTTCPTCTILGGALLVSREASFPYVDQGAECSDKLDGAVDSDEHLDFSDPVNVETTGTYRITYRAQNEFGLWNDGASCTNEHGQHNAGHSYTRTVVVVDTLKPVVALTYKGTLIHRGTDDTDYGVNAQANPMNDPASEHYPASWSLMAVTASSASNKWLAGAVAMVSSGTAMLVYARRAAAAGTVPV